MAIARTSRYANVSAGTFGTGAFTTGSFTPTANSILRVWVLGLTNNTGGMTGFTITDSVGLRWHKHINDRVANAAAGYAPFVNLWWAAVGGSPASMTISVDATQNIYAWAVFAHDFTGLDPQNPFGMCGGAFNQPGAGDPGALSYNLCGTPFSDSWVEAVEVLDAGTAGGTVTEASGWAQVVELTGTIPVHLMDDQSSPDNSVEYTDTYVTAGAIGAYCAVAVELRQSPTNGIRPCCVRGEFQNVSSEASRAVDMPVAADIMLGSFLVARIASDNSLASPAGGAPALTVSDARNGNWTLVGPANQDPGAASAGVTTWIAYVRVAVPYVDGDDVTLAFTPNTAAKAIVIEEWHGIGDVVSSTTAAGSSTFSATGISRTPARANQMVYCALGAEGPWADVFTEDTDTTEGQWTPLPRIGGTNATATNNVKISGSYKVTTGTNAQTWNAVITSRDWAAVAVLFNPQIPALRQIRRRRPGVLPLWRGSQT